MRDRVVMQETLPETFAALFGTGPAPEGAGVGTEAPLEHPATDRARTGRAKSPGPKHCAALNGGAWVEAELKDVGDQALMRGLDAAFPSMRPGLFLILLRASAIIGHKAADGDSPAVVPPPPMHAFGVGRLQRSRLSLVRDRPHEASQFAGMAVQTMVVLSGSRNIGTAGKPRPLPAAGGRQRAAHLLEKYAEHRL
jgi:hypothetical protein